MTSTPTVHIVDDDEAIRDSLRFLLEPEGLTELLAQHVVDHWPVGKGQ